MSRVEDNQDDGPDTLFLDFNQQATQPINQWSRLTDCDEFVGVGRTKHTSVAYQNSIYVFGGINGKIILNDLLRFDTAEMSWSRPPNACPPSSRYHHSAVVHNKSMFIFGGYTGTGQPINQLANCNDLYQYRFSASTWHRIKIDGHKPVPRCGHGCAVYGEYLWIFAGYDGRLRLNDMWRLRLDDQMDSLRWEEVEQAGTRPPTCCNFALVVARDSMYVFSGQSGAAMGSELFRFHFNTNRWYRIELGEYILKNAPDPPPKGFGHTMVNYERHLFVFGGGNLDSSVPSQLHAFDLDNEEWSVVKVAENSQIPSVRLFHTATVIKDSMYIFGGTITAKVRSNALFQFRFSNLPPCTLRTDFGQLFKGNCRFDTLPDLCFCLNQPNVEICAHVAIVTARSKVIESMVIEKTGEQSDDDILKLELNDIDASIFMLVLWYMYTDRIDPAKVNVDVTDQRAMIRLMIEVYGVAARLQLKGLQQMCNLYFCSSINMNNVLLAINSAHSRNLNFIKNICMKVILKDTNYTHLVMSTEFEELPRDLLTEIVRRREIHVHRQNSEQGTMLPPFMRNHDQAEWNDPIESFRLTNDYADDNIRTSLEEDMRAFFESGKFCDTTLQVEGGVEVPAHRAILMARSSYFNAIYNRYPSVDNEVVIRIGESVVPPAHEFQSLLRYIYYGRADMPTEHALYLHTASGFFGFTNDRLMVACKHNLETNITNNNVIDILAVADKLNLIDIKQHAFSLIVKNIDRVGQQLDQLENLNKNLLVQIIQNAAKEFEKFKHKQFIKKE